MGESLPFDLTSREALLESVHTLRRPRVNSSGPAGARGSGRRSLLDLVTAREVVKVSLPLMFRMIGDLVTMLVDRICLARYSETTLAASGPAVFTGMTIIMLATGIVGITRVVRGPGARQGDRPGGFDEGAIGVMLGLFVAVVLLAATPLVVRIPELSDLPPEVVA
ncbi:hypothetical protein ACRAKI_22315 [Saccharothrix isguenensis]